MSFLGISNLTYKIIIHKVAFYSLIIALTVDRDLFFSSLLTKFCRRWSSCTRNEFFDINESTLRRQSLFSFRSNSTLCSKVSMYSFFFRRDSWAEIYAKKIDLEIIIHLLCLDFTLFFIFLRIFLSDFSSAFDKGSLEGIGYPSDIKVRFSSSVKCKVPVAPLYKKRRKIRILEQIYIEIEHLLQLAINMRCTWLKTYCIRAFMRYSISYRLRGY